MERLGGLRVSEETIEITPRSSTAIQGQNCSLPFPSVSLLTRRGADHDNPLSLDALRKTSRSPVLLSAHVTYSQTLLGPDVRSAAIEVNPGGLTDPPLPRVSTTV